MTDMILYTQTHSRPQRFHGAQQETEEILDRDYCKDRRIR